MAANARASARRLIARVVIWWRSCQTVSKQDAAKATPKGWIEPHPHQYWHTHTTKKWRLRFHSRLSNNSLATLWWTSSQHLRLIIMMKTLHRWCQRRQQRRRFRLLIKARVKLRSTHSTHRNLLIIRWLRCPWRHLRRRPPLSHTQSIITIHTSPNRR